MDFAVLFLAIIVKKLVDWIRCIVHGDINGIVTPLVAWLLGTVVIYLSIWGLKWPEDLPYDPWSRVLWGLYVGLAAGTVHDFFMATGRAYTSRRLVRDSPVTPTK